METIKYIITTGLVGLVLSISVITMVCLLWQFIDLMRYNYAVLRGKKPHTKFWDDLNIK